MSSDRRMTFAELAGWGLTGVVLLALGALWHHDRTRTWESPRWDDSQLVVLRAAEPPEELAERANGAEWAAAAERTGGVDRANGGERAALADGANGAEPSIGTEMSGAPDLSRRAERTNAALETWAVAVNPGCALCRGSLARGLAVRGLAGAPVRLAVLVVDTPRRPSSATLASLAADEFRWDSAGAWRHRWGHRIYGELLCFDRSGRLVRTIAPLGDSLATRRALRLAESLRREGGS